MRLPFACRLPVLLAGFFCLGLYLLAWGGIFSLLFLVVFRSRLGLFAHAGLVLVVGLDTLRLGSYLLSDWRRRQTYLRQEQLIAAQEKTI